MPDPFDLERFVNAQNPVFESVLSELRRGRKTGHWMWFIFPQLRGLGSSWMAEHYGISSRAEAKAYLAHPVLSARLEECTWLVTVGDRLTAEEIFGSLDAMKFRSSMTLFAAVAPKGSVYSQALDKYFASERDGFTMARL